MGRKLFSAFRLITFGVMLTVYWRWAYRSGVREVTIRVGDVAFHIPHDGENYLLFRCVKCGSCCRGLLRPIMLTEGDVSRLMDALGYDDREEFVAKECIRLKLTNNGEVEGLFLKRNLKETEATASKQMACRFLSKKGTCTIYAARPMICREFPFMTSRDDSGVYHVRYLPYERAYVCRGFYESPKVEDEWLTFWAETLVRVYEEFLRPA